MNEKVFQLRAIFSLLSSRQRVDQPKHIVEYVVGFSLAQELEDLGIVHGSCFFVNLECGQLYTLLSFSSRAQVLRRTSSTPVTMTSIPPDSLLG